MARVAYLDCGSGISGDMTLAALVDAGVELDAPQRGHRLAGPARLPAAARGGQEERLSCATQITVDYEPEHAHRHLHHILAMIDAGQLNPRQKDLARRIFTRLAEAEAKVHGTTVEKVHFHEVGAADSIADIVGAAVGWDLLGVDRIVASPVPTGMGKIRIAHGECSIPAPATAELLRGIPLAESAIEGELTTPTGAAILATLADSFGPLPAMTIERIGYGAGQKDFAERPNILAAPGGRSGGSRGRRCRSSVRAGNQPRRHQRRADRLLHHAAVGVGRAGRVHHGHPDEEEPAGREADGPLPAGAMRRPSRTSSSARRPRWACGAGWPPGRCSAGSRTA